MARRRRQLVAGDEIVAGAAVNRIRPAGRVVGGGTDARPVGIGGGLIAGDRIGAGTTADPVAAPEHGAVAEGRCLYLIAGNEIVAVIATDRVIAALDQGRSFANDGVGLDAELVAGDGVVTAVAGKDVIPQVAGHLIRACAASGIVVAQA